MAKSREATQTRERRASRRIEASLPARFSTDQLAYHQGVITSVGTAGLFLQTTKLLERGTRVVVETSLGRKLGELRWVAKVAYVNRRSGTHTIPGLGLAFDEPPADVLDQIEAFMRRYPGPVPLDLEGRFDWPAAGRYSATTVQLRLERDAWTDDAVVALRERLESSKGERVVLSHHKRDLVPEAGIPRSLLIDLVEDLIAERGLDRDAKSEPRLALVPDPAPEPGAAEVIVEEIGDDEDVEEIHDIELIEEEEADAEPAPDAEPAAPPRPRREGPAPWGPLIDALLAQCVLIDACEAADWRLERLTAAPDTFLGAVERLEEVAGRLEVPGAVPDREWAEVAVILMSGLKRIAPHVESVMWHISAVRAVTERRIKRDRRKAREAVEATREEAEGSVVQHYRWDRMQERGELSRAELAVGAVRDFLAGRRGGGGSLLPEWVEPALMVVAFAIVPAIGLGAWAMQRFELVGGPGGDSRIEAMQVEALEDGASLVTLASWSEMDPKLDAGLHEQAKVLAAGGFDSATFTHRGHSVAVWKNGYVDHP